MVNTKLQRPRMHRVYARERLYARLDEALVGSVVWIAAPAGAGKTSLVTGYLAARRRKHIWYGVDAADADPANLFLALREGLAVAGLRCEELPPRLSAEYAEDIEGFARQFFRLFHATLPRSAFLVLDNCQEAQEASSFVAALSHAVAEVRDDVGLVIISRQNPPRCFNRFRCQGAATLIGPDEMRLTADESTGLQALYARHDQLVGAETARRRHELTHGWAAGLVLLMDEERARGTSTNSNARSY